MTLVGEWCWRIIDGLSKYNPDNVVIDGEEFYSNLFDKFKT